LRLDLAEKWPERVTHSWVCWATVDQFWGDFVLVWFSSFSEDFVGGFCFGLVFFFSGGFCLGTLLGDFVLIFFFS
jgi:hypothetical protein